MRRPENPEHRGATDAVRRDDRDHGGSPAAGSAAPGNRDHGAARGAGPIRRPEILAPAGDRDALSAALAAGADAVYFGLDDGFNARARAENFPSHGLAEVMAWIHRAGARAYVTLNTLVFEPELPVVEELIRRVAAAGVDAIIVQDPAVALLARAICPALEVHASTQMTASSPLAARLLAELGLSRVVVPRELSLDEIRQYRAGTSVELEVFVHGALCVAWSGQCLSSEAWGGRSANRGQCAQACRLPYSLVVDGDVRDLGEVEYLLSPKDLVGLDVIPGLAEAGVASLKIEGRLKGPAYVATAVAHYRRAAALAAGEAPLQPAVDVPLDRESLHVAYSRGVSTGFLAGADHQTLVEGRFPRHRGMPLGRVVEIEGDEVEVVDDPAQRPITGGRAVDVRAPDHARRVTGHARQAPDHASRTPDHTRRAPDHTRRTPDRTSRAPDHTRRTPDEARDGSRLSDVRAGMGVVFDSGTPELAEQGGPIFAVARTPRGHRLRFGQPGPDLTKVRVGDFVWVSSDPKVTRAGEKAAEAGRVPLGRVAIDLEVRGAAGEPLVVCARFGARGANSTRAAAAELHTTSATASTIPALRTTAATAPMLAEATLHTTSGTAAPIAEAELRTTSSSTAPIAEAELRTTSSTTALIAEAELRTTSSTTALIAEAELRTTSGTAAPIAEARSANLLAAARGVGLTRELLVDKLGALGGTPFHLGALDASRLAAGLHLPVSELKELRRRLVVELDAALARVNREVAADSAIEAVRAHVLRAHVGTDELRASTDDHDKDATRAPRGANDARAVNDDHVADAARAHVGTDEHRASTDDRSADAPPAHVGTDELRASTDDHIKDATRAPRGANDARAVDHDLVADAARAHVGTDEHRASTDNRSADALPAHVGTDEHRASSDDRSGAAMHAHVGTDELRASTDDPIKDATRAPRGANDARAVDHDHVADAARAHVGTDEHRASTDDHFTDAARAPRGANDRDGALPSRPVPMPLLVPLCRDDAQLDAVLDAGAREVELDWMELVGLGRAVERARARGARVTVATVRVQKPGEEKIDAHLAKLEPDAVLVRSWGSLAYFERLRAEDGAAELRDTEHGDGRPGQPVLHGDFSLNVTNSITAGWVLGHGLSTITAAHDLDRDQLFALLAAAPRGRVAVTVHHHIPTFHTEHCVYAHLLSTGRDYKTCGRPCEQHRVALRDRVGLVHPVIVDVGCRNTVFNAQAQSAASIVPELLARGVERFRLELVRETADEARRLYLAYADLVAGRTTAADVVRTAAVHEQFGVTRGTMRTLTVLR